MRISGGSMRGRRIAAPEGRDVRPTSDKVRQAIFNILLQYGLPAGAQVLDLCCGTGVLALANVAVRRRLYLTGGVREERNDGFAGGDRYTTLPTLGASYLAERGGVTLKLRAAYGSGMRSPRTAAREASWSGAHALSGDLRPERQSGAEAGMDLLLGRRLSLHITRYDQLASGLIQRVAVAVPDSVGESEGMGSDRKLGFVRGFGFSRWECEAAAPAPREAGDSRVREATPDDLPDCIALDTQACGLGRASLLASLAGRQGSLAWRIDDAGGRATGFVLAREGRRATQLGPLVAASDAQAIGLLRAALAATPGPVFIDVPDAREALSGWLIAHGFRLQRSFVRMALCPRLPPSLADAPSSLFAVAGPEFG